MSCRHSGRKSKGLRQPTARIGLTFAIIDHDHCLKDLKVLEGRKVQALIIGHTKVPLLSLVPTSKIIPCPSSDSSMLNSHLPSLRCITLRPHTMSGSVRARSKKECVKWGKGGERGPQWREVMRDVHREGKAAIEGKE